MNNTAANGAAMRWTISDVPLLLIAVGAVLFFRLLLLIAPLRVARRFIDWTSIGRSGPVDPDRIGRAVTTAAQRIPGALCLQRALATQFLLRRHGAEAELCLGVANTAGVFTAHAWVVCQGKTVIGEVSGSEYSPLQKAG